MRQLLFRRKKRIYLLLFAIFLLGTFLRFYKIDNVPVSVYWDETASAYNAYSISQTFKDEYGTVMPLVFRSFNDYKLPANIYITAAIVKIFGLNEVTTRASSALLGSFTIILVFFLIKEIFLLEPFNLHSGEKKDIKVNPEMIALVTSFMLAISPWHIQFSRAGFEANTGLFFLCLSVFLFLKGFRNNTLFLLSFFVFAFSLYFYRSLYSFVPMILIALIITCRKKIFEDKKKALYGITIFFLVAAPITFNMFFTPANSRFHQVSIFSNITEQDTLYRNAFTNAPGQSGRLLFNSRFAKLQSLIDNYLSYFSPDFLFIHGDSNPRHGPRGMGLQYLWESPFWLLGIVVTFRFSKKIKDIVFFWWITAPIPASISLPDPHALRGLNEVPITELFTAIGLVFAYQHIPQKFKKVFTLGTIVVIVFFLAQYLVLYFGYSAKITSPDWADGYKQLTQYVFTHETKYKKVLVTGHYWKPYIYFLFYKKYNPQFFQKNGSEFGFDKYVFSGTSWGGEQELGHVDLKSFAHTSGLLLVALTPLEYTSQNDKMFKLADIKDHHGDTVFIVGEVK